MSGEWDHSPSQIAVVAHNAAGLAVHPKNGGVISSAKAVCDDYYDDFHSIGVLFPAMSLT